MWVTIFSRWIFKTEIVTVLIIGVAFKFGSVIFFAMISLTLGSFDGRVKNKPVLNKSCTDHF